MKQAFGELKQQIESLYGDVDSSDYEREDAAAKYYQLDEKLNEFDGSNYKGIDLTGVRSKMKWIKNELDLYDADGEHGKMFPNGDDED